MPRILREGPMRGPKRRASSWWSDVARSRTVRMPSSPRWAAMRPPMPQTAVTGRSPIVSSHIRCVRVAIPPGFANPVAVLAWSFVSPIPTAQVRPVSSNNRSFTARARPSGSSVSAPITASSHPHSSTTTGNVRSTAIARDDASSYAGLSEGRNTASGQRRAASASGIPDRTPNALASYDAVATTWRGRRGLPSPPTTTGRPASSGRRRISTAARNWSRSTCRTQVRGDESLTPVGGSVGRDEVEDHDEVRRRRQPELIVALLSEGLGEGDVDLAATTDPHPLDGLLQTRRKLTRAGHERQRCAAFPRRVDLLAVFGAEREQLHGHGLARLDLGTV